MTRKKVLFVAGWRTDVGDFIREHYEAVRLHYDVTYLHIDFLKNFEPPTLWTIKEENLHGNSNEVVITISCYLRRWGIYEHLIRKALARFLERNGQVFDLVHINVRTPVTEVIATDAHFRGIPVVLTEHSSFYHTGVDLRYPDQRKRQAEIERVKAWFRESGLLYVMPVSAQLGQVLVDRFDVRAEQIRVVPNVAGEPYRPLPSDRRSEDGAVHVLLVALWSYPKNLMLFAHALEGLAPEKRARLNIQFVGDGELVPEFREYLEKKLPGLRITYHGMVSDRNELARLYNEADLLVHPTDAENLPCVIIESHCCGTPVLSNRINGVVELVEPGVNGLLAERRDVEAFRTELERFIDGSANFDRAAISRTAIARFAPSTVAGQLARVYADAMEIGAPGTRNLDRTYQQCVRCVMDTKDDPRIQFDEDGVCTYCHAYKRLESRRLFIGSDRSRLLQDLVASIKQDGQGKPYDCLLGVSGGVDSTYVAVKLKEQGLRPLLVHLDNGWNSELAVRNIQHIVDRLDLDLHTYVIEWEEFRDIQLAFMKASVVDIELVTDFAIVACLYNIAHEKGIKYIISGHNFATESIMPGDWTHEKSDLLNIEAIYRRYFGKALRTFPKLGYFKKNYLVFMKGIKVIPFLNYIDYNKSAAKNEVMEKLGWQDYGSKHGESIFTKFYQNHILPRKFHIDKRKAHLSSLICSGQMTKEEAVMELQHDLYAPKELAADLYYVTKKFGLSGEEFDEIMRSPIRRHTDFPSYVTRHMAQERIWLKRLKPITRIFKRVTGFKPESNYV
jgi:N-acetyl sugar amidotransferase